MPFSDKAFLAAAGLAALCLAGCAGTPTDPAPKVAASKQSKHCERTIGSMLCDDDSGPTGNMNDPSLIGHNLGGGSNGH